MSIATYSLWAFYHSRWKRSHFIQSAPAGFMFCIALWRNLSFCSAYWITSKCRDWSYVPKFKCLAVNCILWACIKSYWDFCSFNVIWMTSVCIGGIIIILPRNRDFRCYSLKMWLLSMLEIIEIAHRNYIISLWFVLTCFCALSYCTQKIKCLRIRTLIGIKEVVHAVYGKMTGTVFPKTYSYHSLISTATLCD